MTNTVIFDDVITLYWDKEWNLPDEIEYEIFLDNRFVGKTQTTHFELKGLQPSKAYEVRILRNGECLFAQTLSTCGLKKRIDVTKAPYFAVGDGCTLNTVALQKAIEDCGAGECVYIPQGTFLTGSLTLHSDMELYVSKGAVLQGTTNVADYLPKVKSRYEGNERECYRSLLHLGTLDHEKGCTCKNIVIRGGGSILGGGYELYKNTVETEREYLLKNDPAYAERERNSSWKDWEPGRARGRLIHICNTENITIANLTLGQGAAWNVQFIYSKNILTFGCKIISEGIPNGDGWDPDSCQNCTIFDCDFETGDDAIAIKSGRNLQGYQIGIPCTNVRIFDCRGRKGIALGSEMSGGVSDVYIWDCQFPYSRTGLRFRSTRKRGGYIRNVKVRNCIFVDLHIWSNMEMNNDGEPAGVLPKMENIEIENLELTGMSRKQDGSGYEPIEVLRLRGNPEERYFLNDIRIRNLKIHARCDGQLQQFEIEHVKNIYIEGLHFIQ